MGYLFITNDIEPYYRDVVNLMAQYRGCVYRFRYERIADFDLIGQIHPAAMEGQQAVIILRCSQTGKLIPIRRVRIERVFDSQYMVVLTFALLDFPDPSLRSRWNVIQHIVEKQAAENKAGGPLRPLIFQIADSQIEQVIGVATNGIAVSPSNEFDKWMSAVHSLSELEFAKKSCFLYLYDIYEDEILVRANRVKLGKVFAGANASYRLEIASYSLPVDSKPHAERDKIPEFSLVLKSDSEVLMPIHESGTVSSRYDDHDLSFRTKSDVGSIGTTATVIPSGVQPELYVPVIEVPIFIEIKGWQWSSLAVAAILYLWSLFGIPTLVPKPSENWAKLLEAVAIMLLASMGKDSIGPLLKAGWNSPPLVELRNAWAELSQKRSP
jgi:hypothetical protein